MCYGSARVQVDSARDVTQWTCYISHWTFVTRLRLRLMSRGAFPGCHTVSFQVQIRISQDSLSLLFVKCQQSALENSRIAEYLTEHHF